MNKKIGLFGGSFDPIHNSHIKILKAVLDSGVVDEIWIIPCYSHNFGKNLVSFEKRVEMIELSFENLEGIKVCEIEKELGGTSRTYDTVMELKKRFNYEFFWISGADCIPDFSKWYQSSKLTKEIEFIIYSRESFSIPDGHVMRIKHILDENVDNISSSNIRERIKNSEDVSRLLPGKVLDYIDKKGLYKK